MKELTLKEISAISGAENATADYLHNLADLIRDSIMNIRYNITDRFMSLNIGISYILQGVSEIFMGNFSAAWERIMLGFEDIKDSIFYSG